jgi:parvulin-like peptidyl-prolyl isomerase
MTPEAIQAIKDIVNNLQAQNLATLAQIQALTKLAESNTPGMEPDEVKAFLKKEKAAVLKDLFEQVKRQNPKGAELMLAQLHESERPV